MKPGTLERGEKLAVRFEVTDGNRAIAVRYQGILPDLFREGQGVIAEGTIDPAAGSRPIPCSPSTTRNTCRRRWPTR